MINILLERLRQKKRTVAYPKALPALPPRFRGRPVIDAARCTCFSGRECRACVNACPVGALSVESNAPVLDTGRCVFCGDCALACAGTKADALIFTNDWRLASTSREGLFVRPRDLSGLWTEDGDGGGTAKGTAGGLLLRSFPDPGGNGPAPALRIEDMPPPPIVPYGDCALFTRSFRLRQVSAAGCGACEADLNVLGTVVFDLPRFGIDYVASPRHADALLITGTVPRNMREALKLTDSATPKPRAVIAVGACAISGGLYGEATQQRNQGAEAMLPVDLFIPGCPPHPYSNLDAMLRFLGQL